MADVENNDSPKKKGGALAVILPLAVLTALGAGGGWFLGGMLADKLQPVLAAEKAAAAKAATGAKGEKKEGEGLPRISTAENGVVQLEPITTNLSYPSESWIRLEVALMFKDKPDVKISEDVHQDILAYLRTVSLQQIEGPRGFQYLRDDIQERVDLRSHGQVSKVMFRTFVIE